MDRNSYTRVGISRNKGVLSVRYTNDRNREKVLTRGGHTDIMFITLDQPERVEDCICILLDYADHSTNEELKNCVQNEAERLGFVFA